MNGSRGRWLAGRPRGFDRPGRSPRLLMGRWILGALALGAVVVGVAASAGVSMLRDREPAPDKADGDAALRLTAGPGAGAMAPAAGDASQDPEARLLMAYQLMSQGQGAAALELASALVRDHPQFSLAQLLVGDLLATRSGTAHAFGVQANAALTADDRRLWLREEAQRRLAAREERPLAGHVPSPFIQLPASVRRAVAIDASRSRLYVFVNGPQGLRLERDLYVSVGKQGIGKRVEGDLRTPLGVYWVTDAVAAPMRDERLGQAALKFNYPNVWDRSLGRTGKGLFLHGVPPSVLAHVPLATDGCVAMANDDAVMLFRTLEVDATPVVIAQRLTWIPVAQAPQQEAAFRRAYQAWDDARRGADATALAGWYEAGAAVAPDTLRDRDPRHEVSIIGWSGDEVPVMTVTSRMAADATGVRGLSRQYWVQRLGRWSILFDGSVPTRAPAVGRTAQAGSRGGSGSTERIGLVTLNNPARAGALPDTGGHRPRP